MNITRKNSILIALSSFYFLFVALNLMTSCYTFEIDFPSKCLHEIKTLNAQNYIIYTHSLKIENLFILRHFLRISYGIHFNTTKRYPEYHKFMKPTRLVLAQVVHDNHPKKSGHISNLFETFRYQAESTNTLFILFSNTLKFPLDTSKYLSKLELGLPALKVLINVPPNNQTQSILLCNGYCKYDSEIKLLTNISDLLKSPTKFHKSLFWNSNKRKILAATNVRIDSKEYSTKFSKDLTICAKLVLKFKNSYYCSAELMSVIYLGFTHNITFNISQHMRDNRSKLSKLRLHKSHQQFISMRKAATFDEEDSASVRLGQQVSTETCMYPIYCIFSELASKVKDKPLSLDTTVWTTHISASTWICILACFLTYIVICEYCNQNRIEVSKILLIFISVLSKQPKQNSYMLLVFSGIILSMLYENNITSVVVSPTPQLVLGTLKEALENGYKFRWGESDFVNYHMWDFKVLGIYHMINTSYKRVNGKYFTKNTKFITEKFLYPAYDVNLDVNKLHLRRNMEKTPDLREQKIQCHTISQGFHFFFEVWEMVAPNREWVFISAARIRESGLPRKWDEWANTAYFIHINENRGVKSQSLLSNVEIKNDSINIHKFMVPFICWISLSGIATIVYFLEYKDDLYRICTSFLMIVLVFVLGEKRLNKIVKLM